MEGPGHGGRLWALQIAGTDGGSGSGDLRVFCATLTFDFLSQFSGNISRVNSLQARTLQLSQFGNKIGTDDNVERELTDRGAHSEG